MQAQVPLQGTVGMSSTTCPGDGCQAQLLNGQGTVGVQLGGTWSGTVQFEQSVDTVTWVAWTVVPLTGGAGVTSTTVAGQWAGSSAGDRQVRVRFSSYASGNALVTMTPSATGISPAVTNTFTAPQLFANGTAGAPAIQFVGCVTCGFYGIGGNAAVSNSGAGQMLWYSGGTQMPAGSVLAWAAGALNTANDTGFSRTAPGAAALGNGTQGNASAALGLASVSASSFLAAPSVVGSSFNFTGGVIAVSNVLPTVVSGFGSGSVGVMLAGSTVFSFRITVGTNAGGVTGVVGLPSASTFWNCDLKDMTTVADLTNETASTLTSATFTATLAWTTGDVLQGGCKGS